MITNGDDVDDDNDEEDNHGPVSAAPVVASCLKLARPIPQRVIQNNQES